MCIVQSRDRLNILAGLHYNCLNICLALFPMFEAGEGVPVWVMVVVGGDTFTWLVLGSCVAPARVRVAPIS